MKRKKKGCLSRLVGLCVFLLLLGGAWLYGTQTIDTDEITVSSSRVPEAFDGFRVAVISDLHGRMWGENGSQLVKAAADAKPDLIAICGDLIDSAQQVGDLPEMLAGLTEIAPCFYVTGNHEWVIGGMEELSRVLEDSGVVRLSNEYRTLTVGGQTIVLAGVDDPNGPYDMKTPGQLVEEIRSEQGDPFIFMLAHRNNQLDMWSELGVDVVVCGHGHGGIVRIPFVGGVFSTDRSLFPKYTSGLYTEKSTAMIVSRGLSDTNIDIRIFNRPHLPVVILEAK